MSASPGRIVDGASDREADGCDRYEFAVFEENLTSASTDTTTVAPYPTEAGVAPPLLYVYTKTIPTFLTIYIFAVFYQIVLTVDALRLKNTIQIIGLCILNLLLMIYGAAQPTQLHDALRQLSSTLVNQDLYSVVSPPAIAVACLLGVGTLIMSFFAWKLYHEFAWTIYKAISADLQMKRRYLTFQVRSTRKRVQAAVTDRAPRSTLPCSSSISSSSSATPSSSWSLCSRRGPATPSSVSPLPPFP